MAWENINENIQTSGKVTLGLHELKHHKPRFDECQALTIFILLGRIMNNVIGFEAINKRLCKVRIKRKYNNLTLINMYAPTEDKTEAEKEEFYDDLQTTIDRTPESDTAIVLGDTNAKLGKEDVYDEVSGKHTVQELSNSNREMKPTVRSKILGTCIGASMILRGITSLQLIQ